MKRILIAMMATLMISYGLTLAFAGEPYAPKVAVPKNVKPNSLEYMSVYMVQSAKVPEKAKVEVPPYPGAYVIQTKGKSKMEVNGKELTCLHYIKLITMDEVKKVVAFYKDKLKGYRFLSEFGGSIQVYWKGKEKFNPIDMRDTCTTPNVFIGKAKGMWDELMKGAKTTIEITYIPR